MEKLLAPKEFTWNVDSNMPEVSIVIITYNRAEMLHRALETAVQQETDGKFSYEIIVIDDGSTDGTSNVVREVAIRFRVFVRYIRQGRGGIALARNTGVAAARGNWIAFFDDDQVAESDWLKNLIDIGWKMGADCVAGTIRLDLLEEELSRLGPVCRSMLGENTYPPKPAILRGKKLPPTGNILINRKVFNSVGLFDTSMLSGRSDTDIASRIRAAGFVTWVAPNAVVHHRILPYRLECNYFRITSLSWGSQFAYINWKKYDRKMVLLCLARIGQALLLNIPCLLLAYLKNNEAETLDRKCLLWRAVGYTRQSLKLLAPRIFAQKGFFASLEFRKERDTLAKDSQFLGKGLS